MGRVNGLLNCTSSDAISLSSLHERTSFFQGSSLLVANASVPATHSRLFLTSWSTSQRTGARDSHNGSSRNSHLIPMQRPPGDRIASAHQLRLAKDWGTEVFTPCRIRDAAKRAPTSPLASLRFQWQSSLAHTGLRRERGSGHDGQLTRAALPQFAPCDNYPACLRARKDVPRELETCAD